MPPQPHLIEFGGRVLPIQLTFSDPQVYTNCKSYGARVLPSIHWHKFTIHHNAQLKFASNPHQLILNGLFDAVEGEEFYPVAYERGERVDTFLARSCKAAVDKLFGRNLTLSISTGATLRLSVQFNVAAYKAGQISPTMLVAQTVGRLMDNLEQHQGECGILNLINFGRPQQFPKVVVSLANLATFKHVCQSIYQNDDRFRSVNGLLLAHNQIRSLAPLEVFKGVDYAVLDLSYNRLASANRLCRELAHIKATELKLDNNLLIKSAKYPGSLKPLQKNFKLIDGVPFDKLYKTYTPLNHEVDVECDGIRIDWTNKSQLQAFSDSHEWHAFMVPDPKLEFTKNELFDYLFVSLDHSLSEFYPCYYKYQAGEHRFLVRNCFDQVQYLVENQNLQFQIPELVEGETGQTYNFTRSISYYLLMNIARFKQGELEPRERIESAIKKGYSALNRLLNLEQFHQTEGLENVVVKLSSPKVLMSILSISSRLFIGNCTEMRLSKNNITGLNNPRSLSLLASLHALDLGHNWIHNLADIESLGVLPLKSLRLHGNPLCSKYKLPSEYIKAVGEIFPLLSKLDGVELGNMPKSGLATQKDFLVNTAAYELVGDLFLQTYLREFENVEQRANLLKFYSEQSMFTMTCSYKATAPQLFKRIAKYSTHSRNLLKMLGELQRAYHSIYLGATEILGVLMQLPNVRHDFVSLQTDVMHYDGKSAVINVTGLLRDEAPGCLMYLAFSRQFILKVEAEGLGLGGKARRFKITNESLNIMNPTPKQIKNAFKFETVTAPEQSDPDSVEVKEHKLLIFQEITGLRSVWCTRCLEDAKWDYERALKHFLKLESDSELPDNAFL